MWSLSLSSDISVFMSAFIGSASFGKRGQTTRAGVRATGSPARLVVIEWINLLVRPGGSPSLRPLVVWVGATRMVGRVEDLADLGNRLLDRHSDPLLQCHVGHPTAVAPTPKGDVGDTILHIKQRHGSAVSRHAGIDSG